MKRYLIAAVVVMTVLAVSWVVLAQEEQKPAAGQAPAAQAPSSSSSWPRTRPRWRKRSWRFNDA